MRRIRFAIFCLGLAGCGPRARLVVSTPDIAMPFCTRTLGVAECFADPGALLDRPAPLGDMPVRVHVTDRRWWGWPG